MKYKDCANYKQEYHGERNQCIYYNCQCNLTLKHDIYNFSHCDYIKTLEQQEKAMTIIEKTCKQCGLGFKAKTNRTIYCSDKCRTIARRESDRLRKSK